MAEMIDLKELEEKVILVAVSTGSEQILIRYHGQVGFAALDEHLGAARDYKAGDGHYHDAGGEAYLLERV